MGDRPKLTTNAPLAMARTSSALISALCLITIAIAASSPEDQIVPEADFSILKDFEEAHDTLELVQDQASWTYCAKENHHCKFSGKARVKYGAKGKYAYNTKSGGVRCSNGVFGDPKRGTPRKCYYQKVVKKKAVKKKKASNITKRDCKCRGHEMAVDAGTSAFLDAMTAPADGSAQLVQVEASTELVTELVQAQAGLKGTTCEQWNGSSGKKWCTVSKSCKAATGVVNNVLIKGKCIPFCHSAGFKVPSKMKCGTSDHVVETTRKEKAFKEKPTKKKAAEKKEKAKSYKTIRSDGSSPTKPACSWNSKCKWNAESKAKCATQICQLNGYKKGKFIKTFGKSNNMCKQSATTKSVWNLSYDKPGKPVKGAWGSEAFFEVGCGTDRPGVTIKTDGSQKKPYCSWNSKCKWNAEAKAACAKKMCQLNGFKKGKFIWASNNMCKVSATSKSVWNLSWDKPGKPVKGKWGSEAAIEA